MKPTHDGFSRISSAYDCSTCGRCFIAFGEVTGEDVVCVCGGIAEPRILPSGVYELRSPEAADRRPTLPPGHVSKPDLVEVDKGYGKAHGYGPAHGGPTGPGDAPAPVARAREAPVKEVRKRRQAPTGAARR